MRPPLDRGIGNDLTQLFLPVHLQLSREVHAWCRPAAWDTTGFGGRPRVGNPQASLWYPPVWLAWWSGHPAALGWLTIGHLIVSGLGAYTLSRFLQCHRAAAVTAGMLWAASPFMLGHVAAGHLPHVWTTAWYPWCFLALFIAIGGQALGWLTLSAGLSLAFLAGHPQEWFYLVLTLACATLFFWIKEWRSGNRKQYVYYLFCFFGSLVLILGLTAVAWLPAFALRPWTAPWRPDELSALDPYRLRWIHWIQLLSPFALGGPADYVGPVSWWETVLGAGPVPCALVLCAAFSRAEPSARPSPRFWFVLLLISLSLAMGRDLGLHPVLVQLCPPLAVFRVPARFLFLSHLALSILCAHGWDGLTARARTAPHSPYARGLLLLILGVFALTAWIRTVVPVRPGTLLDGLVRSGQDPFFWLGMSLIIVLEMTRILWSSRRRQLLLLSLVALSLLAYAQRIVRIGHWEQAVEPVSATAAILAEAPPAPFRIRTRDALYGDLSAMLARLEKTNVQDAFQIHHAAQLVQPLYGLFVRDPLLPHPREADPRAIRASLDLLNVAFVLTDTFTPAIDWPVVATAPTSHGSWSLRKHPSYLPRAYIVPHVHMVEQETATEHALIVAQPRESVIMNEDPLAHLTGARQPFTPASYQSSHPDLVEITVRTEAPGLLVIADTWLPGWSATLNGRPVPILRGNIAQRVIPICSSGSHHMIMRYEPLGLNPALVITGLTTVAWLLAVLLCLRVKPGGSWLVR